MAQPRHLPNAPIIEAVVDLRVLAEKDATVEALEEALGRHDFGYRRKGPIIQGRFGFSINLEESPQAVTRSEPTTIVGVRLHSVDERYVAQFTLGGFTLSRLQPYESWENLIEETKRTWGVYLECLRPDHITRAATRFINNLRLPRTPEPIEHMLKMMPVFPEELPQLLYGFLERFLIYDAERDATAILTQALDHPPQEDAIPVILDIDVFRESRFSVNGSEVWDFLQQLRVLKNKIFFGSLTEAAVALYL